MIAGIRKKNFFYLLFEESELKILNTSKNFP